MHRLPCRPSSPLWCALLCVSLSSCVASTAPEADDLGEERLGATASTELSAFEADELSLGVYHSCARDGEDTYCWGLNVAGQLGIGVFDGEEPHPSPLRTLAPGAVELAAAGHSTHIRRADGTVWSWGAGYDGQIGVNESGASGHRHTPIQTHLIDDAMGLSGGWLHVCALRPGDEAWCWGDNWLGGLGDGSFDDALVPQAVPGLGSVAQVSAGWSYSCARLTDGAVWCWGDDRGGQLGDGTQADPFKDPWPEPTLLPVAARHVETGRDVTCAITPDDRLWCWGGGPFGTPTPTEVTEVGADVVDVAVGDSHLCVLKADSRLYCWGGNTYGQVGNGTTTYQSSPTLVAVPDGWVEVAADGMHTCGRRNDRSVWCWGHNTYGESGQGTFLQIIPTPTLVEH